MTIRDSLFILFVADQAQSRTFYEAVFEAPPVLDVPGMTEFALGECSRLGLMPETGIARFITPALQHPGGGAPRCELYLRVDDPEAAAQRAIAHGATPVRALAPMAWRDVVVYVADPDGHVLAFARPMAKG